MVTTYANHARIPNKRSETAGFTFVELLLIGTVLAALLGAGGGTLVRLERANSSEQQQNSAAQRNARQLLQQEFSMAESVSTTTADLPATCADLEDPVVLHGPGSNWRIAYALVTEPSANGWRGPAQLLRCGPPHGDNGPTGGTPLMLRSVVLDRLTADQGFRVSISTGSVVITLQPHSNTGAGPPTMINARLASAASSATERFPGCRGLCKETDTTNHWRPSGGPIAGDANKRDVLYFPLDLASYELSTPCDRSLCTVTGIPGAVIVNGDLLVFRDQEIQLP